MNEISAKWPFKKSPYQTKECRFFIAMLARVCVSISCPSFAVLFFCPLLVASFLWLCASVLAAEKTRTFAHWLLMLSLNMSNARSQMASTQNIRDRTKKRDEWHKQNHKHILRIKRSVAQRILPYRMSSFFDQLWKHGTRKRTHTTASMWYSNISTE